MVYNLNNKKPIPKFCFCCCMQKMQTATQQIVHEEIYFKNNIVSASRMHKTIGHNLNKIFVKLNDDTIVQLNKYLIESKLDILKTFNNHFYQYIFKNYYTLINDYENFRISKFIDEYNENSSSNPHALEYYFSALKGFWLVMYNKKKYNNFGLTRSIFTNILLFDYCCSINSYSNFQIIEYLKFFCCLKIKLNIEEKINLPNNSNEWFYLITYIQDELGYNLITKEKDKYYINTPVLRMGNKNNYESYKNKFNDYFYDKYYYSSQEKLIEDICNKTDYHNNFIRSIIFNMVSEKTITKK